MAILMAIFSLLTCDAAWKPPLIVGICTLANFAGVLPVIAGLAKGACWACRLVARHRIGIPSACGYAASGGRPDNRGIQWVRRVCQTSHHIMVQILVYELVF